MKWRRMVMSPRAMGELGKEIPVLGRLETREMESQNARKETEK